MAGGFSRLADLPVVAPFLLPAAIVIDRTPSLGHARSTLVVAALALVFLPGAIVAISAPDTVQIPVVKTHEKGDPPEAATFSHWAHDGYQCYDCHPGTFPEGPLGFTHADMARGRFCGSCHDGHTAWSPKGKGIECEACHVLSGDQEEIDEDDLW